MKRVFVILLVLLVSCKKDDALVADSLTIEQYIDDNGLSADIVNGVYRYEIVDNLTGNDQGSVFSIYYQLENLETGEIIDSHLSSDGDPISLKQGSSSVVPIGLDNGLSGLREGETYGIIIPKKLGFGNYEVSTLNPQTILHFTVEVVSRQTEAEIASDEDVAINDYIMANDLNNTMTNPVDPVMLINNGVYYKKTGNGNSNVPVVGDSVTLNYSGRYLDETEFDALNGFKFVFGSGGTIPGFEAGINQMEEQETGMVIIPSAQAYGGSVRVIPFGTAEELQMQFIIPFYALRVEPYKVLKFDVTLQTIH